MTIKKGPCRTPRNPKIAPNLAQQLAFVECLLDRPWSIAASLTLDEYIYLGDKKRQKRPRLAALRVVRTTRTL